MFPENNLKPSIIDSLKVQFPDEPWDNISIKFDQIGDIGLLRLDPNKTTKAFREQVGTEIINRYPRIVTVVNKFDITNGVNRVFPIELLAGERKFDSWHKEYGVLIKVDLQRAYFNPRLAEEHRRISLDVSHGERILDLFTGVGPFALHCTKHQICTCFAVDINQNAINNLMMSIKRNKLKGSIIPIVGDSSRIIRENRYFDRVIMNLPGNAIQYLNFASKCVKNGGIITFYQFIKKANQPEEILAEMISRKLMDVSDYKILRNQIGREVSPSKIQMNIDIRILKNH
jgi:tRNA (guanine37-N1)-methyltransferase